MFYFIKFACDIFTCLAQFQQSQRVSILQLHAHAHVLKKNVLVKWPGATATSFFVGPIRLCLR